MIYLDVCDFNGNVTFKQDFDSCELLCHLVMTHFSKKKVAELLSGCCCNHTPRYNNPALEQPTFDKNSILS